MKTLTEEQAETILKLSKDREFLLQTCKLVLRINTHDSIAGIVKAAIDSVEGR